MAVELPTLESFRSAVELACQPQNAWRIVRGRELVVAMPRPWVLENIRNIAQEALDLTDSWEFRRLLELLVLLDAGAVRRHFVALGLKSADPDVREAAEDFEVESDLPRCNA